MSPVQVLPEWMKTAKMYDIYGGKGIAGPTVSLEKENKRDSDKNRNGMTSEKCTLNPLKQGK